jgi:hypothetical protein
MPENMPRLGGNLVLTIGAMFNTTPADWLEFEVTMIHPDGAEGWARFELLTESGEPPEFEPELQVEGGLPNSSFVVEVGGWNFGDLTTDSTGYGTLLFASEGSRPPALDASSLATYGARLAAAIDQILGTGAI